MSEYHDNDDNDAAGANPECSPERQGRGGESITAQMIPLLVDTPGGDRTGVVWLCANRADVVPGTEFTAKGRRWVVTGLSPSGVTFMCREVLAS
jgi:hypothetical protein